MIFHTQTASNKVPHLVLFSCYAHLLMCHAGGMLEHCMLIRRTVMNSRLYIHA